MDVDDSVDSRSQSESPPPPTLPKLTLLLPPLKDLKKSSKKSKGKSKSKQSFAPYSDYPDASTSAQKAPRPVKLKPLKEVLSRLVVQLKKCVGHPSFGAAPEYFLSQEGRLCVLSETSEPGAGAGVL
jgi:bromodomain-containing protein 7/9